MLQNIATQGMIAMVKRVYLIKPILINGVLFKKILIDSHVDKHADHINDELILEILNSLNKDQHHPIGESEEYLYYVTNILFHEKWYKLTWLIEKELNYLGVISIFRDRRIK